MDLECFWSDLLKSIFNFIKIKVKMDHYFGISFLFISLLSYSINMLVWLPLVTLDYVI